MMHTLQDLDGTNIVRGQVDADGTPTLTIMAPSGFSEQGYYPAESVTITSRIAVASLHELLSAMLMAINERSAP